MTAPSTSLRVLFHTQDWAYQNPGGAEVQLLQTRRALQDLGVTVDLFDLWHSRVADYPLVHSFSLFGHRFWPAVK
ncbi:hypothetical protein LLH03_21010, partial [bacterium]|nr:hypothetical protein [bacterium]